MWRGCRREPASDRESLSVSLSVCLSAEDTDASGCAPRSLSCYLVDPASSHMLVSKIKPCMSKFTLSNGETANGSLNQSRFLRWSKVTWITVVILELIHAEQLRSLQEERALLLVSKPVEHRARTMVTLDNFVPIAWP